MFVVFSGPVGSTALADDEDDNDNGDNGVAGSECGELPSHAELLAAISETVHDADGDGFNLEAWATIVNRVKGGEISYHVGGVKLYHSSRLDPRCCCS